MNAIIGSVIKGLYYFLLELLIDKDEEKMFSSYNFATKRWVVILIVFISLIINFYLAKTIWSMTDSMIIYRKNYTFVTKELHAYIKKDKDCH